LPDAEYIFSWREAAFISNFHQSVTVSAESNKLTRSYVAKAAHARARRECISKYLQLNLYRQDDRTYFSVIDPHPPAIYFTDSRQRVFHLAEFLTLLEADSPSVASSVKRSGKYALFDDQSLKT
jgi:hypothetical protein